jgi:hypothetical protein
MAPETENVEFVCCQCQPNAQSEEESQELYSRTCPVHGLSWHRRIRPQKNKAKDEPPPAS